MEKHLEKMESEVCPTNKKLLSEQQVECPFGFGKRGSTSEWEQAIAPLCCPLCHALLFQSQQAVPCGHCYCKPCSMKIRDCLLCAADVDHFISATSLDTEVDSFIRAHSHNIELLQKDHELNQNELAKDEVVLRRTTFLLYQAVKAMTAGNLESAMARLKMADEDLTSATDVSCLSQRTIVLGKMSDILFLENHVEEGAETVKAACALLDSVYCEKNDMLSNEQISILATTHSKAGDIYNFLSNEDYATFHYSRALQLRDQLLQKEFSDTTTGGLQKAVLLVKLANCYKTSAEKKAKEAQKIAQETENLSSEGRGNDAQIINYITQSVTNILRK